MKTKLDWNTNNNGTATHTANDGVMLYYVAAPADMTLDEVATEFLRGYDDGDTDGDVEFFAEELATETGAHFAGQPDEEASRK
jgi:hypothetical protein